jgi:hypothetical protein
VALTAFAAFVVFDADEPGGDGPTGLESLGPGQRSAIIATSHAALAHDLVPELAERRR